MDKWGEVGTLSPLVQHYGQNCEVKHVVFLNFKKLMVAMVVLMMVVVMIVLMMVVMVVLMMAVMMMVMIVMMVLMMMMMAINRNALFVFRILGILVRKTVE